ncbi:MAG: DUF1834 family protein [Gammaproteobacteria bacterium]|nr:DUF1834 family protein [Gammaproteobacteria bacterium]
MNLDLTILDDAVLSRLQDQCAGLRTIATLEYEEQVLENTSDPLPAVYTLINGAAYDTEAGNSRYQEGDVTVTVFVKTRNLRGFGAARKADDGAYAMIQQAATALLGYAPGGCGYFNLVEIGAVRVTKLDAIYAIQFTAATEESY